VNVFKQMIGSYVDLLKFIWNGQFYRDFKEILAKASTENLFYLIPAIFLQSNSSFFFVLYLYSYQNSMFFLFPHFSISAIQRDP
jgi:hypothetical protein